jgi:hypothetical protein
MAVLVDARPSEVVIKFLKGADMSTTFYYLDSAGQAVDLSTYTANIEVVIPDTGETDTVWSKTLPLAVGNVMVEDVEVLDCSGVVFDYSAADTEVEWESAKFICNIVDADGASEAFLYGTFTPTSLI